MQIANFFRKGVGNGDYLIDFIEKYIIYEDLSILVIMKAPGLPMTSSESQMKWNVLNICRFYLSHKAQTSSSYLGHLNSES